MISLHKISTCLMLVIVTAAAAQSASGGSAPAASSAAPATVYGNNVVPSSGVSTAGAVATPRISSAVPVRYSTGIFYGSPDNPGAEPVLVLPAGETNAETVARIAEDLSVMGRIFEKNALGLLVPAESASVPLLGRLLYSGPGAGPQVLFGSVGRVRPLYAGGYGAVFFIQVDFPLLPPAEKAQEQSANQQEDHVWAETRRSLLEPQTPGAGPQRNEDTPPPYSRARVDRLRKSLISTMRHATNIRALEPNERLTVTVQGFGSPSAGAGMPLGRQVMTLQAKKADVDLYAKGQLSETEFEQRVQVVTY